MKKIRMFEAFAGYGSQSMAMERLRKEGLLDYEVVGISEIDKYAIKAYYACHDTSIPNFGDISKIDWTSVPDFDLFTYSFPCTDISNAGLQKGFGEGSGTRSGLLWECRRAIETKKPTYLLMENVKALISKKFKEDFSKWLQYLESLGYNNYYKVLNAKDFGIPQNRERVFMVSVLRGRGCSHSYNFPKPFELTLRLRDILEDNVPESYYLSDEKVKAIIDHCDRKQLEGCGFKTNFQDGGGISGTIKTKEGQREYDTYIKSKE